MVKNRVADPDRVDPDLDLTFKKNLDPNPTLEDDPDPDPT